MNTDFFEPHTGGHLTSTADPVLLGHFVRNLETLIALNTARGVRTVFIPQVMNASALTGEKPLVGLSQPFIPSKDFLSILDVYNQALIGMAEPNRVWVIDDVLSADWRPEYFADEGHFVVAGSELFAETVAPEISRICGPQAAD